MQTCPWFFFKEYCSPPFCFRVISLKRRHVNTTTIPACMRMLMAQELANVWGLIFAIAFLYYVFKNTQNDSSLCSNRSMHAHRTDDGRANLFTVVCRRFNLETVNISVKTPIGRLMCYMCRMNVVTSTCAGQVIFYNTQLILRRAHCNNFDC